MTEDAVAEPAEDIKAEEEEVMGLDVLTRLAHTESSSPSRMDSRLSTTLLLSLQAPSPAR